MTNHFIFFLIDCATWITLGFLTGFILYPHKRKKKKYPKIIFATITGLISFISGITLSATKGIPDQGFYFYSLFHSLVLTFSMIWVVSAEFKINFSKYIKSLEPKFKTEFIRLAR